VNDAVQGAEYLLAIQTDDGNMFAGFVIFMVTKTPPCIGLLDGEDVPYATGLAVNKQNYHTICNKLYVHWVY
jgi:hypothetical protein